MRQCWLDLHLSIATVAFGVALIAHGGAVSARLHALPRSASPLEYVRLNSFAVGVDVAGLGAQLGAVEL